MRRRTKLGLVLSLPLVAILGLFLWNGLEGSWATPETGLTEVPPEDAGSTLRVLAFNAAKLSFHRGGLDFASDEEVRARIAKVADMIRASSADLVFLSEVVFESGTSDVNQVVELAEQAGFHAWTYGDNYSWGIPFLRIRSGNAILSRFPMRGLRVVQLIGEAASWNPSNQRRLLLAEVQVGERWLVCGSVRNDSFDLANNARQVQEILEILPDEPVLLAGDLNARPGTKPMRMWQESGRFQGVFDGAPTFPAKAPERRLDSVLVPASFSRIVSESVLDTDLSDHEPVLVVIER